MQGDGRPHVDVTAKHDVVENAHSPEQGQVLKRAGYGLTFGIHRSAEPQSAR